MKPKMSPKDLYASKKADDVSYFIPPVESGKTETDSPVNFNPYKTPLLESNVIVESETNPKICTFLRIYLLDEFTP